MNETIGNLSQTIVKLPNFFKSSVFNAPTRGSPYNYKKPPIMDTFNQVKKLNIRLHKRIFRLNDFLKIKNASFDLNFNNNRRYFSPDLFRPIKDFNSIIYGSTTGKEKIEKNNDLKNSNNMDNNFIEKNDINDNNENEKHDENDENKSVNDEEKTISDRKIMNLSELKQFLDKKTFYGGSKKILYFPKISNFRYTQEELFKCAINKKIDSLTTIKPSVKQSIFLKNKNYTLERDYYKYKKFVEKNQRNANVFRNTNNTINI